MSFLNEVREKLGVTVASVERKSGVSYLTASNIIKKGPCCSQFDKITKVCNALGVTIIFAVDGQMIEAYEPEDE